MWLRSLLLDLMNEAEGARIAPGSKGKGIRDELFDHAC